MSTDLYADLFKDAFSKYFRLKERPAGHIGRAMHKNRDSPLSLHVCSDQYCKRNYARHSHGFQKLNRN